MPKRTARGQAAPSRSGAAAIWVYAGSVAAAGLVLAWAVAHGALAIPSPGRVPWPILALALAGAHFLPADFVSSKGQRFSLDPCGVLILFGMVFTTPRGLMLAATVAVTISTIGHRDTPARDTPVCNTPVKALFNAASQLVGVAAALAAAHAALGGHSAISPRGWLALAAGLAVYDAVTGLLVLGAITLTAGSPGRKYLASMAIHWSLAVPVNVTLGILAVNVGWTNLWAVLLLAVPGAGLALWYRSANALRGRYANLQSLYGFTLKLADLAEGEEVLTVALREIQEMLGCRHVQLALVDPSGIARYRVADDGRLAVEELADLPVLERGVAESGRPILMGRSRRRAPGLAGFAEVMAVPVHAGSGGPAVLVAASRGDEHSDFDDGALRLFEALAAHLGTALASSRHLDRLRQEIAAREHQALHDGLTGLANRALFSQGVASALRDRPPGQLMAVMLMDLDGFKEINDTLGHHAGDAILQETGKRVARAMGRGRLAARLGGDEFAFVIPAAGAVDEVSAVARRVLASVSEPIAIEGLVLTLRASIGVALAPWHGDDPATLLKRADVAMYAAKTGSRGVTIYDTEIDHHTTRRLILATELRRAIEANHLEVWYQPVASARSGHLFGFEALLRWRHAEFGPISPEEFIPIAEQTGLIGRMTWGVLRQALAQRTAWAADGYELNLSVNVSARSLLDDDIVDGLARLLAETGAPPDSLTLEITESSIMLEPDRSEHILGKIAALGVRVAIDDFGTGYSSLSRLKRLPVRTVKIDRSFVMAMSVDQGDEAIVRTTIELARNMGLEVMAAGVEDRAAWDRLAALGCDYVQGYYLSAALPPEHCRAWMRRWQPPRLADIRLLTSAQGA